MRRVFHFLAGGNNSNYKVQIFILFPFPIVVSNQKTKGNGNCIIFLSSETSRKDVYKKTHILHSKSTTSSQTRDISFKWSQKEITATSKSLRQNWSSGYRGRAPFISYIITKGREWDKYSKEKEMQRTLFFNLQYLELLKTKTSTQIQHEAQH